MTSLFLTVFRRLPEFIASDLDNCARCTRSGIHGKLGRSARWNCLRKTRAISQRCVQSCTNFFVEHGVLLRPLGNVVYVLPPYVIEPEGLHRVYDVIVEAIETLL